MKKDLSDQSLLQLSDHLAEHMGINFSADRLGDLKTKMSALAEAFEFDDLTELCDWLVSDRLDREQIELLADFLTVGETYFFRDPNAFTVLEDEVLPHLVESRKQARFLRIWSAACCTGEEPYSIAMLLKKVIPDIASWQIKILATDINRTFLERAQEGTYGEWSFRATPKQFRELYFKAKRNNQFQIDSQIRKMVQFEWMNLAELELLSDHHYRGMDIIFCRNVLIYFSADQARRIISALSHSLIPDGYLFVSPNELPVASDGTLRALHRSGAIILQKQNLHTQPESVVASNVPLQEHTAEAADEALPTLEAAQNSYELGNYEEAAQMLLKRCHRGGDFSSLVLLAKSLANHGELKKALRWCDQAIKVNRLNAAAHYLRATILQEQNANVEAIHSLRQALLMDPTFIVAHLNLGILLRQTGIEHEAQKHFKTVSKLLGSYQNDDILPESEGTTASGMRVIVSSLLKH